MDETRPEVLQGTLDLMILKALDTLGPLHGFGLARRLEQISGGVLRLNEGTVYTALVRLGQRGWISSSWGASELNVRVKRLEEHTADPAPALGRHGPRVLVEARCPKARCKGDLAEEQEARPGGHVAPARRGAAAATSRAREGRRKTDAARGVPEPGGLSAGR